MNLSFSSWDMIIQSDCAISHINNAALRFPHNTSAVIALLNPNLALFEERFLRPPTSPEITTCDYFSWGT
jgi:hypothetical protein